MAKIHVFELSEIISTFPDLQTFDPNRQSSESTVDLFLCVLGFEERCLHIPSRLHQTGFRAQKAYYLEYSTIPHDNATNRPSLLSHLESISENVQSIGADEANFSRVLRELIDSLPSQNGRDKPRIFFDMSVASNKLLMRCMQVFLEADIYLSVLYSEAAIYRPTKEEFEKSSQLRNDEFESVSLEVGVSDVSISEEYAGFHVDLLPDCVIIFPSFNRERALAVVSSVDPSLLTAPSDKIVWVLGVPHLPEDHWRLDMMRKIMRIPSDSPLLNASTFDYKETLRVLDTIYRERVESFRFTLSPMGSKLQALGASLFCYMRPDVRIIFATPKEYNASKFSDGCKATWIVEFGALSDIRDKLDNVGQVSIED